MSYAFRGRVETYNSGYDIADDSGHLATCESKEIAETICKILNECAARLTAANDTLTAHKGSDRGLEI